MIFRFFHFQLISFSHTKTRLLDESILCWGKVENPFKFHHFWRYCARISIGLSEMRGMMALCLLYLECKDGWMDVCTQGARGV